MPTLIEKLRSSEPSVCIEAAEELAVLGPAAKDAVPALMDLLDDHDANVRASAAIALGRIGPDAKEAVAKLAGLLEDSSELILWAALFGLGGIGPAAASAVPAIVPRLRDEVGYVSFGAMRALGNVGPGAPTSTVPALIDFLSHQDDGVVWVAASTLAKMGEAAVPALIEGLKSDREDICWACATALGEIGPAAQAAVPALITMLSSPKQSQHHLPSTAATALGEIGPAAVAAIPALVEALRRDHIQMHISVAGAMKGISPERAVPQLIPLLAEEEASWGASHVLTEIGAAAVPNLVAVLNGEKRLSRFPAYITMNTLRQIGPPAASAVPVLVRLLRDSDSSIRCEAAETLAAIQGR